MTGEERPPMSDAEFRAAWAQVSLLNTFVVSLDPDALAYLRRSAQDAQTLGPLVDPSAFLRPGASKFDDLQAQVDLLNSVIAYRETVVRLADRFGVEVPT